MSDTTTVEIRDILDRLSGIAPGIATRQDVRAIDIERLEQDELACLRDALIELMHQDRATHSEGSRSTTSAEAVVA